MSESPRPWHDCPPCRGDGCGLIALPITEAANGWSGPRNATLFCPACGDGWVGTAAEVAQAARSTAAWEAEEARQERDAKAAAKVEKERAEYRRLTGRVPSPAPQPEVGPEPVQLGLFGGGK